MTNLLVLYIIGAAVPTVLLADGVPYSALLKKYKEVVQDPPTDASRIELWRSGPGRVKLKRFPVKVPVPDYDPGAFNTPDDKDPEGESTGEDDADDDEATKKAEADKVQADKVKAEKAEAEKVAAVQSPNSDNLLEVEPTKPARKKSTAPKDK